MFVSVIYFLIDCKDIVFIYNLQTFSFILRQENHLSEHVIYFFFITTLRLLTK
jgi:hypothetical protein